MVHRSEVAYCPECDAKINMKAPKLGQFMVCRACDTKLEVIDLKPLELDWAFEDRDDDDVDDLDLNLDYDDDELLSNSDD